MIKGTYEDYAEVASKNYSNKARQTLEFQLNHYTEEYPKEVLIELGLPQVLMFFSSTIAKSNNHEVIEPKDVEIAFAFLRYILSRNFIEELIIDNQINIGIPQSNNMRNRFTRILQIKGDMKTKNNIDNKLSRLVSFLSEQKLNRKHINRLEIEIRATILLFSRLFTDSQRKNSKIVTNVDIDKSYDIIRHLIFKLDPTVPIILNELYQIDDERIWRKIPKIIFDQSSHDHLSSTAYAEWENHLPESFESLKKYLNCSSRPFLTAIFGYTEIYGAKKEITRVNSDTMLYILEDFEKYIFGNLNPLSLEDKISDIKFTKKGLDLLSKVSKWIQAIIVNRLGKDEYMFNFSSTVPRHMSLLLLITIIERVRYKVEKIDIKQVANAIIKWTNQLKILATIHSN